MSGLGPGGSGYSDFWEMLLSFGLIGLGAVGVVGFCAWQIWSNWSL